MQFRVSKSNIKSNTTAWTFEKNTNVFNEQCLQEETTALRKPLEKVLIEHKLPDELLNIQQLQETSIKCNSVPWNEVYLVKSSTHYNQVYVTGRDLNLYPIKDNQLSSSARSLVYNNNNYICFFYQKSHGAIFKQHTQCFRKYQSKDTLKQNETNEESVALIKEDLASIRFAFICSKLESVSLMEI